MQLLLQVARAQTSLDGIDPRDVIEEMEHLLVDNFGTNADGFVAAITPCSKYVTGADTVGEQSTAQWVRMVFHDFVTADLDAGTG